MRSSTLGADPPGSWSCAPPRVPVRHNLPPRAGQPPQPAVSIHLPVSVLLINFIRSLQTASFILTGLALAPSLSKDCRQQVLLISAVNCGAGGEVTLQEEALPESAFCTVDAAGPTPDCRQSDAGDNGTNGCLPPASPYPPGLVPGSLHKQRGMTGVPKKARKGDKQ